MRVGTQGLFRMCLKTFVAPFLPARLTAPGSPRMPNAVKRCKSFPLFKVTLTTTAFVTFSCTVISSKVVGKNVHATIPKCNMRYDQYTVPNDFSCRTYFGCFPLVIAYIKSRAILSNFFEEQCTQNHPQYLSGLSPALFPTTFLEIAV